MKGSDIYVNQNVYVDGDPKPSGAFIGQELKATNGKVWEWSGDSWGLTVTIDGSGAPATPIVMNDALANERNAGTANQYGVGVDECNGSILDASTGAQAVSVGAPAILFGIQINTALAGTLTITGLTNVTGAATNIVLPIATPIGYYECKGAKCNTALVCTLSDATDDVLVLWRPQ